MKRTRIGTLIAGALIVSLAAGCGNTSSKQSIEEKTEAAEPASESESESQSESKEDTEKEASAETEKEVAETEKEDEPTTESEALENKLKELPVLEVGSQISMSDVADVTLDFSQIVDRVDPPAPGSYFSYYESDEGKTYVDVCFAYKNTDTSDIKAADTVDGTLIYAGKYEYSGFPIVEEDNRSDFTYANISSIAPLSTEYIHYLFTVPSEVKESDLSIDAILSFSGTEYRVVVREGAGEEKTETTENENSTEPSKTGGEVVEKETVTTSNSEFYVDFTQVNNRIDPQSPGSYYSYYEAENGKTYVDVCFAYKNTSENSVKADSVVSATLKYADKYDYKGFSFIEEDNRSDFTYSNISSIAPLSTEYVHYLFEVPEEVVASDEPIVISFTVDGGSYTYKVR